MFTPPPSPQPPRTIDLRRSESPSPLSKGKGTTMTFPVPESTEETKRRAGRRLRLAVLLVPLTVILFSLYQTYLANRVSDMSFTQPLSQSWHGLASEDHLVRVHRRNPQPEPQTQSSAPSKSSSSSSTSSTATRAADQPLPTIPSSPPVLPTPFPQPFGDLGQNFSSASCSNFFLNMTGSAPFRSCRPFSLLLGTSPDFINAQSNLTLMNNIIWGTCNTNIDYSQCQANMAWFASSLKDNCVQELNADYTLAVETLQGLNAFSVMHDAACSSEPTSNSYCYVNAVRNANPADLYYYQLPLGIGIPKTAVLTCSSCSVSVMNIYAAALRNPVMASLLSGLKATYDSANALSAQSCGSVFAQGSLAGSGAISIMKGGLLSSMWLTVAFSVLMWMGFEQLS